MPRKPRLVSSDAIHAVSTTQARLLLALPVNCMPVAILSLAAVCKGPITTPGISEGVHKKGNPRS